MYDYIYICILKSRCGVYSRHFCNDKSILEKHIENEISNGFKVVIPIEKSNKKYFIDNKEIYINVY